MKKAVCPGSFDPVTNGHIDIIKRAAELFDEVIVGIGVHSNKTRRFDKNLMKKAIEQVITRHNLKNVKVICYDNLSVDAALNFNSTYLVRGIRNGMDYEYEENIAAINEEISGLDTIYIRAGKLGNISSSMVNELLKYGKDVKKYLPQEVMELVKK